MSAHAFSTMRGGAVFSRFPAGTGKGVLRPEKTSWPPTFSPFSAPELQDAEIPYDSLPVDKGHLLPIIHPCSGVSVQWTTTLNPLLLLAGSLPSNGPGSLRSGPNSSRLKQSPESTENVAPGNAVSPADQPSTRKVIGDLCYSSHAFCSRQSFSVVQCTATSLQCLLLKKNRPHAIQLPLQDLDSPQPSGPTAVAASGGQEGDLENAGEDALASMKQDDKAHWKLRALANIRRHSDSEIFISHAQKRYYLDCYHHEAI